MERERNSKDAVGRAIVSGNKLTSLCAFCFALLELNVALVEDPVGLFLHHWL